MFTKFAVIRTFASGNIFNQEGTASCIGILGLNWEPYTSRFGGCVARESSRRRLKALKSKRAMER